MSENVVHYALERAIATVTLDSPGNRNALSTQLVGELSSQLSHAADDEDVRAVVLTHTGTVFCAGADLKEQAAEGGPEQGTRRMLGLLEQIVALRKPVVAVVDGAARAGGLGVLGACDIVLASTTSTFAFTEARLGLAPAIISLTTLGRMTERAVARYYLTGETFDGVAAADCGLITVATEQVRDTLADIEDALRAASPQGLAESKALTTRGVRAAFAQHGEQMQALSARLFASDEAREGIMAFLQKRPPNWTPR